MTTVQEPSENDVLCGRGGSINSHPGNERFRTLVEKRKRVYLTARFKREKRLIASSIVSEIRALDPPGRFLSREAKSGLWKDIGDEKARDKTSQALRENAPSIRAEIETEIQDQRAELQKEEQQHFNPPNPPPPPPPHYYNNGWGSSYTGSYYGHYAPQPPPQPHAYPGYEQQGQGHWGHAPPPHAATPTYYGGRPQHHDYHHHPHHHHHGPPAPKSALESTADYISSGAESIKNWARLSTSASHDARSLADSRSVCSRNSQPIVFIPGRKRCRSSRSVTFCDDEKRGRPCYSPIHHHTGDNSLLDGEVEEELEPMDAVMATDDQTSNSVIASFASQVFSSIGGSWEAPCGGHETMENRLMAFPDSAGSSAPAVPSMEENVVEWEGQEVQLLDRNEESNSIMMEDRMPPPRRQYQVVDNTSVGLSSLGSCHSWIPEQLGSAASSFFGGGHEREAAVQQPTDYSATGSIAAGSLAAGSIGGGSLERVFENEAHHFSQMPSWEQRSIRSRSPMHDDDDESLVSKSSSKVSELSPRQDGIMWDNQGATTMRE